MEPHRKVEGGRVLAARKSARIDARLKKKLNQQETEENPIYKKILSTKGKSGTTPKRGRRKKDTTPTTAAPAKGTKATAKLSPKATKSSGKSLLNASAKRTAKRKADDSASFGAKRAKNGTPGTTPCRKSEKRTPRQASQKKNKSSPIQFDYGVPSPIETERESMDDEDSPNQALAKAARRVVTAETAQKQSIRIPLDPLKPFTFKSEQACKLWEAATKERAELIRRKIENRDFVPDWLKRQLEGSLELTASQTRNILNEDKSRRAQGAIRWLKLEEKVLDLDAGIKLSLRKEYADTDLEKCIDSLEKLLRLPVDPLTLKKYPDLAMTPCLLQKYKGAVTKWTLSSQEKDLFCSKRETIWGKAKALQQKYMDLFGIKDHMNYVESFNQRLQVFQNSVSNFTEDEISLLVHDPSAKKVLRKKNPAT